MKPVIALTKVYDPLNRNDRDTIQWEYKQGSTLSDLLDSTGSIISERETVKFVVSIDGTKIEPELYDKTYLMSGQHIAIIPYLHGGGGGKDIIRMVGMIILAVVASIVSYGIASTGAWGLVAAESGAAYGLAAGAASAIMMVGSMVLNAVLPPSYQSNMPTAGADKSNAYSWNPSTTQQQGVCVPVPYGTCKLSGNIIGVYRESIGSDQYLNILISLGMGPLSDIYDIKLNNQLLSNYHDVELYTRLGTLNQDIIPNFGDTTVEYALSIKVVKSSPVVYTTTGNNFDKVIIEVSFPTGLLKWDDTGTQANQSVSYSIEMKKHSATTWEPVTKWTGEESKQSLGGKWSAGYWVNSESGRAWFEFSTGSTNYADHVEGTQSDVEGITWRWFSDVVNTAGTIAPFVTASANSSNPQRYSWPVSITDKGQYDIRITRITDDSTDARIVDELYLTSVKEVVNDDFAYPNIALVALRVKATDQLSGSFSFECKTKGKLCRIYDGTDWSVFYTSNPAWLCFDILTQPVFDDDLEVLEYAGHNPSIIDIDKFLTWSEYCDELVPDGNGGTEPRLTFNGQFDSTQTMWDSALAVCKIGRAAPYWRGQTITLSIDMPSDPVTLITVGNIGIDSFEETFLSMENRAGYIEADFLNIEKELERDKFTVINPDAPAEWGSSSLQLTGVIKPSEIWRHCRYYLATTQNLIRTVTVVMDVDSIAFTLGDVINIQHDVPIWGDAGGRIVSASSNKVTIDRPVTILTGQTYVMIIRTLDNTIIQKTVINTPGIYSELTLSTSFATVPEQYDLYAFGRSNYVVKPMRVISIDPQSDLKRKITLIDYNATIWNADILEPVLPTINYSPSFIPVISNLQAVDYPKMNEGGILLRSIVLSWEVDNSSLLNHVEIYARTTGEWKYIGRDNIFDAAPNTTYEITVIAVNNIGAKANFAISPTVTITTGDLISFATPDLLPAPIVSIQYRIDADGSVNQLRVRLELNSTSLTPTGLSIMVAVQNDPRRIGVEDQDTQLLINDVDILSSGTANILAGSTISKIVITTPDKPLPTNINVAGFYWAQYTGTTARKGLTNDSTSITFNEPFDVEPPLGLAQLQWVEISWDDSRIGDFKLLMISNSANEYEIVKWVNVHQADNMYYIQGLVREQEGTTKIINGDTAYYYPAPGAGTETIKVNLDQFTKISDLIYEGSFDVTLNIPSGAWVSATACTFITNGITLARSYIVPVLKWGIS